ncbi:MAG: hypothetical protein R3F14_33980 [Polyangiaceae bacterium]
MRVLRSLLVLTALSLGLGACADLEPLTEPTGTTTTGETTATSDTDPIDSGPLLEGDCDPIVPSRCGLPFPSNIYLADDETTATGKAVHFGATSLPKIKVKGTPHIDPASWYDSDGFSTGQAPFTHMPGATIAGFPTQDNIEFSLTDNSPTVLLNADTGERVPHFAELDMSGTDDEARALMLRPAVRLNDATRYIVAIRRVKDAEGNDLPPSDAFAALRDNTPTTDYSVRRRRALYDDIFKKLEDAGVGRSDLQIAWDYTTASRENNTRWLVHMRDDALAKVGDDGPSYVIDTVEDNPNPFIRKRIYGRFTVPVYTDIPGPGGTLVFGDDGMPKYTGTAEYEFVVHLPNSVTGDTPGALLQNGHGLLGTKNEGRNGYLAELSDKHRFVSFSIDLIGMADEDTETVQDAIGGDVGAFKAVVGRQHQGILNSLLAMRMMAGQFAKDPLMMDGDKSMIDTTQRYYRGDSQGGIFGTTYMALTTDVTRGLLGEPGMPYNLLLNRSSDFTPFFFLLDLIYGDAIDLQLVLGLVQMHWDRTEPNGYAPYITENLLPGTPKHEVLLHVAIGDYQVTPLGAHLIARAVGAKNLLPVNRSVWGIEEQTGPFMGSGMVEFDFNLPMSPLTNTPPTGPSDDDPHDKVRVLDAAYDQTNEFLRTGVIKPYCDGPCNPE